INTDPLFCNPDSGDFTLAENSPAVGAGENGENIGAFGVGCNIQVDWDFSLSEPVIEVMGADNVWNPGDTISVEMDFCNNTDVAHNWYPGVTIESDSSLTSLHSGHIWFYAMDADECHTISWGAIANTSVISDTVVTFIAYPEALNCQNQPEYCIDGDTLTFEVPIVVQVVSAVTESFAPEQFSLHQNYPNPFNPVTTLRYDLPENSLVNITIYDMMGREVKTIVNQTQDAGYRSVVWDATNDYGNPVSAGIYLYQIQAGNYIQTKKMVLLK
ncbi:MAG: T9SS type A sorting domain-containing protein, partial [Candidatus Marinimicrobia bacterium]|nr:T9SS type A sorting domain-containing protein [Candidatus Neomarinimicrobiota bacterium]